MRKVVIFSLKDYAEPAHYYLTHDSSDEVVAFEDVQAVYLPGGLFFFAPKLPKIMNRDREAIYQGAKRKGYCLISYVSSTAPLSTTRSATNVSSSRTTPTSRSSVSATTWCCGAQPYRASRYHSRPCDLHLACGDVGALRYWRVLFFGSEFDTAQRPEYRGMQLLAMAAVKDTEAWGVYKGNPTEKLSIPSAKMRF